MNANQNQTCINDNFEKLFFDMEEHHDNDIFNEGV